MVLHDRPVVWLLVGALALVGLYVVYRIIQNAVGRFVNWLRRLFGGRSTDRKYADPDAQRAHEAAQQRDLDDAVPVGGEFTAVVRERTETTQGPELRVRVHGVQVFVDDNVPDHVAEGDEIDVKITHHSGKNNAAHARYVD